MASVASVADDEKTQPGGELDVCAACGSIVRRSEQGGRGFDARYLDAFAFPHPSLTAGQVLRHDGVRPVPVRLPLSVANRHGLIAGATGTGKTKTLQSLAEQFSRAGVPVFVADIKGDLSGLCRPGVETPALKARATAGGADWFPYAPPTRLWSLTGRGGAQVRASLSSFGPLLLSRVLDLNETQGSVLSLVFKVCRETFPLVRLEDLEIALRFLGTPKADSLTERYGGISKSTIGVIQRRLLELGEHGVGRFIGNPELDVADFFRVDERGHGMVNILDLTDVQRTPKLFSTAMLWILAELFERLPERGDADRPVLAFFFDEAHLLFNNAPESLVEQVEMIVRLIRSKGVGVYFVTQTPNDVPEAILGQLGNRVQHALRAFTPKDRKGIRAAAENFPETEDWDVEKTLTTLGTGEALCSFLSPSGAPSPTVVARIAAPRSRMGPLTDAERAEILAAAPNVKKYGLFHPR